MEAATSLHTAIRSAIDAPSTVTKSQMVALLAKFPFPEAPAENDLVIRDGILSVDLRECTCAASGMEDICGSAHENHCGLEPLLDISLALERGSYRA